MGLDDLIEKLKDVESSIYEAKENLHDVKVTIFKALEILENVDDDELYSSNQELSADLDNVIDLLNELIDED